MIISRLSPSWGAGLLWLAAVMIAGAAPGSARAQSEEGAIARGGRLYDNWITELKLDKIEINHPAWPASNTSQKGGTTWRCKSCHGWDYLGKDGAYASGSYLTGIGGIRKLAGADPARIVAIMKDQTHGLAGKLGDQDFADLALFVSKGQVDHDTLIDRSSKAVKGGDAKKGAAYYQTVCLGCHGKEGDLPDEMPTSLASLLARNPWETLHKVWNGQPHEPMPATRAFDPKITADILAYVATLPKKDNPPKKK